jgi:ketosteroid isomerase-like protein
LSAVTNEDLRRWIEAYERAWRSAGTDALARLFDPGAHYSPGPYEQPLHGLEAIAAFWESEREGPDEPFELSWSSIAVQGDTGVARVSVRYDPPHGREYRDLWIVRLTADGRAGSFEEWPFFPAQPLADRRP